MQRGKKAGTDARVGYTNNIQRVRRIVEERGFETDTCPSSCSLALAADACSCSRGYGSTSARSYAAQTIAASYFSIVSTTESRPETQVGNRATPVVGSRLKASQIRLAATIRSAMNLYFAGERFRRPALAISTNSSARRRASARTDCGQNSAISECRCSSTRCATTQGSIEVNARFKNRGEEKRHAVKDTLKKALCTLHSMR